MDLLKKEDVIVQSLGSKPIIKVEFNPKQECKDKRRNGNAKQKERGAVGDKFVSINWTI